MHSVRLGYMYQELGERLSPASCLATAAVATLKTQEAIWLCAISFFTHTFTALPTFYSITPMY
uniref:Uncharacterized protein n=1 Tax=Picea sitchensis TaxID=3332 RepID=A9NYD5_PICSI|nr:unknown [Picea sitchensis]